MPEQQTQDNALLSSLGGEETEVIDEAILDDMPDEDGSTFGEKSDEKQPDGESTEEKPAEESTLDNAEEKAADKTTESEEIVDWKARAEKSDRIARGFQSRYDQTMLQIQPYAAKLADIIKAENEQAAKLKGDRDALLREFATNPYGVIQTLVASELQQVRSQAEAAQVQIESQNAYHELVEYASERKVDAANLAVLLAPYNNFANLHPRQALELAKVLVDKAVAPQVNQQTAQEILKATDAQNKQKLIKKTPAGQTGGAVQGREKSESDKYWDRIKNSGPRNPLRSLR